MDKSNWFLPRTLRQWRNKFPSGLPDGPRAVFLELIWKIRSNPRLRQVYERSITSQVNEKRDSGISRLEGRQAIAVRVQSRRHSARSNSTSASAPPVPAF